MPVLKGISVAILALLSLAACGGGSVAPATASADPASPTASAAAKEDRRRYHLHGHVGQQGDRARARAARERAGALRCGADNEQAHWKLHPEARRDLHRRLEDHRGPDRPPERSLAAGPVHQDEHARDEE